LVNGRGWYVKVKAIGTVENTPFYVSARFLHTTIPGGPLIQKPVAAAVSYSQSS